MARSVGVLRAKTQIKRKKIFEGDLSASWTVISVGKRAEARERGVKESSVPGTHRRIKSLFNRRSRKRGLAAVDQTTQSVGTLRNMNFKDKYSYSKHQRKDQRGLERVLSVRVLNARAPLRGGGGTRQNEVPFGEGTNAATMDLAKNRQEQTSLRIRRARRDKSDGAMRSKFGGTVG